MNLDRRPHYSAEVIKGYPVIGYFNSYYIAYVPDANTFDRSMPMPSGHDVVLSDATMAHKTLSTHYKTDADTNLSRLQLDNKRILGYNSTTKIVNYGIQDDGFFSLKFFDSTGIGVARFGQFADGTIALKVAKSGQEVDSASNTNLIFNSSQNVFKIVTSFTVTNNVVLNGTGFYTQVTTQAHGLGFTPSYQAFITIDSFWQGITSGLTSNGPNPFLVSAISGDRTNVQNLALHQVSVDATNIKFSVYCIVGGTGATLFNSAKVYLLQETAT